MEVQRFVFNPKSSAGQGSQIQGAGGEIHFVVSVSQNVTAEHQMTGCILLLHVARAVSSEQWADARREAGRSPKSITHCLGTVPAAHGFFSPAIRDQLSAMWAERLVIADVASQWSNRILQPPSSDSSTRCGGILEKLGPMHTPDRAGPQR